MHDLCLKVILEFEVCIYAWLSFFRTILEQTTGVDVSTDNTHTHSGHSSRANSDFRDSRGNNARLTLRDKSRAAAASSLLCGGGVSPGRGSASRARPGIACRQADGKIYLNCVLMFKQCWWSVIFLWLTAIVLPDASCVRLSNCKG